MNRLINAEEANLARTVRAADRQLLAIERLESDGSLPRRAPGLRAAGGRGRGRRDADPYTRAAPPGVRRSAVNHRLRRLVELAGEEET